jgi:predicted component of type VI protein secretion system
MHTQILTVNQQDRSHEVERSEEAAIVSEMAIRFIELKEATSAHRAASLISKLHALSVMHPEALWLVMALLTGDLSQITRSYADIGKESAKTKQAVQQSIERSIKAINTHFPNLAVAIIELRHITASITEVDK